MIFLKIFSQILSEDFKIKNKNLTKNAQQCVAFVFVGHYRVV